MYYNHNIRTSLQEWKGRLYKATNEQFGHQLKYCINNIEKNKLLFSLISDSIIQYPFSQEQLKEMGDNDYGAPDLSFEDEVQHASYCYQFLKYFIQEYKDYNLHHYTNFHGGNFEETKKNVIEELITPLFYYLHDKLDKSNSIVYLLEKYKRRTEWFTYKDLLKEYQNATKSYEQIFEDDLRLFLFDQGIDYPFSTPKSTSGRGDIIGAIETDDPLIIEIKVLDKDKSYGKQRVIDGFSQIIKYTNDYSKDLGYLVIFNTDNIEIEFVLNEKNNLFPPMISFNNKTYFIVVINLHTGISASKIGTTEVLTINETELTK
ncbi:hypothetical protein [Mucilaginibacter sp. 14171R-50]|uniref:hypothetical protein n=1 Tax=Mucilaginibacter sp. 14171R-50 TaxID=2703789 RepID=UPI00192E8EA1|nr:hypothetical protein [Mucilaginibacter sp. 14171R-50]